MNERRKILAIVGPTATGKSALAVSLARKFVGEIISADSRQVYKGLDIGTGKVTKKEMRGVPHHLLDVADPKQQFSVALYQALARKKLEEILSRGKLPIIVGGTGLYVQALTHEAAYPEVKPDLKLRKTLHAKTPPQLYDMLKKLDPRRADTIDCHNPHRLVRAIEIARSLGKVPAYRNAPREDIDTHIIGLTLPRDELKEKIAKRLSARMKSGMVAEAKRLHAKSLSWKRMEALGLEYRYLARYLKVKSEKQKILEELQREIYKYAKRQMTWFRKDARVRWFSPSDRQKIEREVRGFLRN